MAHNHTVLNGRVRVYRRNDNARYWQAYTFLEGQHHRITTKEESLARAKEFAEDWYLDLRGKQRSGTLRKNEKTFGDAAKQFMREYETITEGLRSPRHVDGYESRLRNYLIPFFGDKGLSEITPGLVQEYRIHRRSFSVPRVAQKKDDEGALAPAKPPSRSTMHKEIVTIRQVLKTAIRHGWLSHLPDLSMPYKTTGKLERRAWFSPEEYKRLYQATRRRAQNPKRERWREESENLHDWVLFMANSGLRPGEDTRLQFRDVAILDDEITNERILQIEVRGKRGVGYCKTMPGAVRPFERIKSRRKAGPMDLVFPKTHRELFKRILEEEDLRYDRDGRARTAYSLRHTYISMRLMEGADIYQIAKNCRTSVEMIEKHYAAHIANMLDTQAINVKRPKRKPKPANRENQSKDFS